MRAAGNERDRWTQEQRRQHAEWAEEKHKWARQHPTPHPGAQHGTYPGQAGTQTPTPATPTPTTGPNHQRAPTTTGTNHALPDAGGNPQAGTGYAFHLQTPEPATTVHHAAGPGFGGAAGLHGGFPLVASLSPNLNFTLEEEF